MPKIPRSLIPLTVLERHIERWMGCIKCDLHKKRSKLVFVRGSVPCDIVFIGEAPGFSEDVLGKPFVGQAGQLLDSIIAKALAPEGTYSHTFSFTNLVCCIPKEENNRKSEEPDHDHILACQERLAEFIDICRPRLIVRVGKLAREYLDRTIRHALRVPDCVKFIDIMHPAAILRANYANRGLLTQRVVVQISNAAEDLGDVPGWADTDRCTWYTPKKSRLTFDVGGSDEYTFPSEDVPF